MGFEPIRTDVQFDVNTGQFKAEMGDVEAVHARTIGAMSEDTIKLAIAQEKLNRALLQGPESLAAKRATLAYRQEVRAAQEASAAQIRAAEQAAAAQAKAAERAAAAQLAAFQKTGRALTHYVTLPTTLIAFEAVKMGVDFQRQMLLIQTQAGASAREVHNLSGQVLELARTTPQGPGELAKGLYHLESLGLRGATAMHVLRTSAIAAGMGIANLEDVTTALGAAVVTGIKGTENYDQAMATLNATIGAGNMRMEDLTAALGTGLLSKAQNAGLSLDQVGAALATLTDRGMGADEAATRLGMTFALTQRHSATAKGALKDLGIEGDTLAKLMRQPDGLLKVIQLLHDRMESVGKVRGAKDILGVFGGGRSSGAILALIQSLDSGLSGYAAKLDQVRAGEKKFGADTKTYLNSSSYKLHKDLADLEVDLVKLGGAITPVVTAVAGGIGDIADALDHLPGFVKKDLGLLVGILAVGGPFMLGLVAVKKGIRLIGTEFALLPVKAGPAIAATDAELATLGATASATAGEVGAVGGASRVAATGGVASLTGAFGKAGLAGAVLYAGYVLSGFIRQIPDWDKAMRSFGGDIYDGFSHTKGGKALGLGDPMAKFADTDVAQSDPKVVLRIVNRGKARGFGDARIKADIRKALPKLADHDVDVLIAWALREWARLGGDRDSMRGAYAEPPPKTDADQKRKDQQATGYEPSQLQQLDLALAKHPNDPAAIRAKLASDKRAIAFAERRIKEGKGSKAMVAALQQLYQDEHSLQDQLKALHDAAATKRKSARDAVLTQRQKRLESLTRVPVELAIAEATARSHGASEEKIVSILEREKAALEKQIALLVRIGAAKKYILEARQREAAVQKKIDTAKHKSLGGRGGSFYDEAAAEFALYGSNVAGRGSPLSGQDARGLLAQLILLTRAGNRHAAATAGHTGAIRKTKPSPLDAARTATAYGY